jgi:Ni,Fe-hydrogenase I small subunit
MLGFHDATWFLGDLCNMIRYSVALLSVIALLATSSVVLQAQAPKAKRSIKEVMEQAHKDGLLKKVLDKEATKEEKDKLLDLYIDMLETAPPQGENSSWIMLAGKSVVAAGKVAVGREGAENELKEATNCAACHRVHKPN